MAEQTIRHDSRVVAAREYLDGDPDPTAASIVEGAIDAYEERLRVNVGLVRENAELRREVSRLHHDGA